MGFSYLASPDVLIIEFAELLPSQLVFVSDCCSQLLVLVFEQTVWQTITRVINAPSRELFKVGLMILMLSSPLL